MTDSATLAPQSETFSEGQVATAIERQTAKLPSDTFLWAAMGSIGASFALQVMGYHKTANFVGQWAPTILVLGVYNKMVKLHGTQGTPSEQSANQQQSENNMQDAGKDD